MKSVAYPQSGSHTIQDLLIFFCSQYYMQIGTHFWSPVCTKSIRIFQFRFYIVCRDTFENHIKPERKFWIYLVPITVQKWPELGANCYVYPLDAPRICSNAMVIRVDFFKCINPKSAKTFWITLSKMCRQKHFWSLYVHKCTHN